MRRRKLIRYAGAGLVAAVGTGMAARVQPAKAQSALSIQWLGHTCFFFQGGGRRILVNPFKTIGCTAGYRTPKVQPDLVMVSSLLFDEGYLEEVPRDVRVLTEAGVYEFSQAPRMTVQGISTLHDNKKGYRFGTNVVWKWNQAGLNLVHMGGIAEPIADEEQILIGRPDVMFVPVGGGPKAYSPEQAADAVEKLNPKIVVPTQYRTRAADAALPKDCDIVPLEQFLGLMSGVPVQNVGGSTLGVSPGSLPSSPVIRVFSYNYPTITPPVDPEAEPAGQTEEDTAS